MNLMNEAERLRETIKRSTKELEQAEMQLALLERSCQHQWGETEYVPEHQAAYTIQGDPPGTMGVDRRLPCSVPAKTVKKWRRACSLCGKVEVTNKVKTEVKKSEGPQW